MWYVRDRFDFVCELVLVTVCAGEIEPCVCVVWLGFFYLATAIRGTRTWNPEGGTTSNENPAQPSASAAGDPVRVCSATAAAGTPF